MANWKNLDQLQAFEELKAAKKVNIREAMTGESGADRVRSFSVPIAEGLDFNYAARPVDADLLAVLAKLAEEAELSEKYKELYEGAVINTGEKRLVLHQLCRGQLGKDVIADGVNKREFYVKQQERIAEFAKKVHAGEITNAAGEKFTTVVQIGIGGSDLGPRAIYIALENWARRYGKLKMEAKFISNVDPDDASAARLRGRRAYPFRAGIQIRNDAGDADQRVLCHRCAEESRSFPVESYDRRHQRDVPAGEK